MKDELSRIEQALLGKTGQRNGSAAAVASNTADEPQEAAGARRPEAGTETDEAKIQALADALVRLIQEGLLPENADLRALTEDAAFVKLLAELPPYAAARVYLSEKRAEACEESARERMTDALSRRNALPRSTRGGTGNATGPDYASMDSAEFIKLKNAIQTAARGGRRIPL